MPSQLNYVYRRNPQTGEWAWRRTRATGPIDAARRRPPEMRECPACHRSVDVLTKTRPYTHRSTCPSCRESWDWGRDGTELTHRWT